MNLFEWLLIGHLVGDFLLQTNWMAEKKKNELWPLVAHSLVYTACVSLLALPGGGLSFPAIVLIFLTHLLLDKRSFVNFWAYQVTKSNNDLWLKIIIDQSWHIIILALATLIPSYLT